MIRSERPNSAGRNSRRRSSETMEAVWGVSSDIDIYLSPERKHDSDRAPSLHRPAHPSPDRLFLSRLAAAAPFFRRTQEGGRAGLNGKLTAFESQRDRKGLNLGGVDSRPP